MNEKSPHGKLLKWITKYYPIMEDILRPKIGGRQI